MEDAAQEGTAFGRSQGLEEDKRRPVWAALDDADQAVSRIDNAVTRLLERLGPVISPRADSVGTEAELRQAVGTQLEGQIRSITDRIHEVERRVRATEEDLGL